MTRHYAFALVSIWTVLLNACASTPEEPTNGQVLQFYTGALKPMPDIAILKSTDIPAARRRGNEEIKIELHGINSRRFNSQGGLGNGTFEVHLWPGTYTVYLRYSSVVKSEGGEKKLYSHEDQSLTLVVGAGHTYTINGDRLSDITERQVSWRPVVFDKTRVVAWRKDEKGVRLSQQRAAR